MKSATSNRRHTLIALVPFVIAVPGVIVAVLLWFWRPLPRDPNAIAFGVTTALLVFGLPVCILVLIEWLRTGEPPELSLSPLIQCREEREFHRNLRKRQKLNDGDFYDTYYANSGIPRRFPMELRMSLEGVFGLDFAALHPADNLIYADVELDWADLICRVNREFDIAIPKDEVRELDGTFDSLLRCIVQNHRKTTTGGPL